MSVIVDFNQSSRARPSGRSTGCAAPTSLSTFVLMSQNQSARNDEQREQNNHLTDLWSEAWAELIGEKLGIDAAEFLGREDTLGSVEPGKQADLVLLDANPLDDVAHLHGIAGVVRAGRYHSAAA